MKKNVANVKEKDFKYIKRHLNVWNYTVYHVEELVLKEKGVIYVKIVE